MLIAYVDESGNHGGDFFVLGGFLFTTDEADRLQALWNKECAQYPQTLNFHMQEAQDVNSEIWGWGPGCTLSIPEKITHRDRRFVNLLSSILAQEPLGAYVWFNMQDFNEVYKDQVPQDRNSPYFVLFFTLMFGITKLFDNAGRVEQIQFVFDDQQQFKPSVERYYADAVSALSKVNARAAHIMGLPPQFRDDNNVLLLKSADMLVWLMQRDLYKRLKNDDLLQLMKSAHGVAQHVTRNMLENIRDLQKADKSAAQETLVKNI